METSEYVGGEFGPSGSSRSVGRAWTRNRQRIGRSYEYNGGKYGRNGLGKRRRVKQGKATATRTMGRKGA